MRDEAYFILSEGVPGLIDRALMAGATFDEVIAELKAQVMAAEDNRDEYDER